MFFHQFIRVKNTFSFVYNLHTKNRSILSCYNGVIFQFELVRLQYKSVQSNLSAAYSTAFALFYKFKTWILLFIVLIAFFFGFIMFSRRRTNIFNLFSGVCVGVLPLFTNFDLSCGQPQEATATFSSGGVEGSVKIVDGSMSIVLEIDDFSLIPAGESCFDGGIFYHIHEFWNDYSNLNLFGSSCGATYTGGHWDPWLGCGSATGNDYCESQGGCAFGSPVLGDSYDGTYECSSLADTNLYTCEVGDLSSIFGALDFEETDYGLEGGITVSEFFLPPASYLEDKSMVFHCNDGTRAFCAPFKLHDDMSHSYQQQVKQS